MFKTTIIVWNRESCACNCIITAILNIVKKVSFVCVRAPYLICFVKVRLCPLFFLIFSFTHAVHWICWGRLNRILATSSRKKIFVNNPMSYISHSYTSYFWTHDFHMMRDFLHKTIFFSRWRFISPLAVRFLLLCIWAPLSLYYCHVDFPVTLTGYHFTFLFQTQIISPFPPFLTEQINTVGAL